MMKKLLVLAFRLVLLTGCLKKVSKYDIKQPTNGKHHAIIRISIQSVKIAGEEIPGGQCTAFVISDTTAITAGHCLFVTKYSIKKLKREAKKARKYIVDLQKKLDEVRLNCRGFQCALIEQQILIFIRQNKQLIKFAKKARPDKIKVFTIKGEEVKTKAFSLYSDNRRDYGFIRGNFKHFNKLNVAKGFSINKGDILRACGFAGAKTPPVCINYEAVGKRGFEYAGRSMYVPGMSGGPVLNSKNEVVGINSASPADVAIMTPILGVIP